MLQYEYGKKHVRVKVYEVDLKKPRGKACEWEKCRKKLKKTCGLCVNAYQGGKSDLYECFLLLAVHCIPGGLAAYFG